MYSNNSLGAIGRSLNIDDIEKYMTYNKNSYPNYGREYSPSDMYYPLIFADEKAGAVNGTYGTRYGLSEQDSYVTGTANGNVNSSFKGKWTYYRFTMGTSTMQNQTYVDLFSNSTDTWLASRCVYYDSRYAYFGMFYVSDDTVEAYWLYRSYGDLVGSYGYAIRPVVEIDLTKVNVGLTGDGSSSSPYSIEAK